MGEKEEYSKNGTDYDTRLIAHGCMKVCKGIPNIAAFTDADVELVEGLVSLKNLDLSRASVTVATFERLTGLRQLEFLALNGLTLSDQDMEALSKLRQVKAISLIDAKCSEEALQRFAEQNPDCTIAR